VSTIEFMDLNNYENRHELLIDWILNTVPQGASILDIGANDGTFCPEVRRLAVHAGHFAGVDPDCEKLAHNPLLNSRYPTTLEDAQIPEASFDCAYAIYVFEHVNRRIEFLRAANRLLKPGGSLYFITPNGYHYFAQIASILGSLGWQRRILELIRPAELVEAYHYPALYRLNQSRLLRRLGIQSGFESFEFRYSEKLGELTGYFPGALKVLPWVWERMVNISGQEYLLGNLMGRMTKPLSSRY